MGQTDRTPLPSETSEAYNVPEQDGSLMPAREDGKR